MNIVFQQLHVMLKKFAKHVHARFLFCFLKILKKLDSLNLSINSAQNGHKLLAVSAMFNYQVMQKRNSQLMM